MAMHTKDKLLCSLFVFGIITFLIVVAIIIFQSISLGQCTPSCPQYMCMSAAGQTPGCSGGIYLSLLAVNIVEYFITPVVVAHIFLRGEGARWKVIIAFTLLAVTLAAFVAVAMWFVVAHIQYWSAAGLSGFGARSKSFFICRDVQLEYPGCLDETLSPNARRLKLLYFADAASIVIVIILCAVALVYGAMTVIRTCKYRKTESSTSYSKLFSGLGKHPNGDANSQVITN